MSDPAAAPSAAEVVPDGPVLVSLARFEKERDALLSRNTPVGVLLQSDQSPEKLGEDVTRTLETIPANGR